LIFWELHFISVLLLQIFLTAVISISLLLWKFYRDPDRITCPNEKVIYSPADGRILYIKRIKEGNSILSEKKKSVYKI
jgi:phosphatidylserine decarboxylase